MAINLGDNIKIQANLPIDYRYFNNLVPYTSKTEVINTIPVGERYLGLTVNINNVEYWFENAILVEDDLVLKINAGTLTGATNGLHLVGGGTQVALGGALTGDTEFSGGILKYQTSPVFTDGTQIIDKNYADAIASGVHPKLAVQVATTGQTTLSGLTTIDGIALTNGDRVLVKNQTNQAENGIYVATGGTWQWSDDFNYTPSGETVQGTIIPVITGATNRNTLWVLVSPDPILSGSSKVFTLYSTVTLTAGNGIIISGSTIIVDGANLAGTYVDWDGTKFNVDAAGITSGYVTQSSLNTYTGATQPILDAAITGATNGLTKIGRNATLGGTLTSDVTISMAGNGIQISGGTSQLIIESAGITLGFSGQSVSFDSNAGLTYDGDYSGGFTARSIPDVAYVTGLTSGGSVIYQAPLAQYSTVEVGGLAASTDLYGMTSNEILEKILVKYLAPTFSSFSMTPITTPVEVGTQISGSKTFTFTCTNTGNIAPTTLCVLDVTAGSPLLPINDTLSSPKTRTITTKTFTSCLEVQSWRLSACDVQNNPFYSSTCTIIAYYPYFWGIVNAPGPSGSGRPTAAQIVTLVSTGSGIGTCTKVIANSASDFAVNFNSTGSDYMWLAIPSSVSPKLKWCVTPSNCGSIGGAVNPGGNLFPDPVLDCAVTSTSPAWSTTYDIYISNKQSENTSPMGFKYV